MNDAIDPIDDDGETADIEAMKDRMATASLPLSPDYDAGDHQLASPVDMGGGDAREGMEKA